MVRVHGPLGKAASNAPLGVRECQWCGEYFVARATSQLFCCDPHRAAFNNLRKQRGALVIDLLMTMRYDRGLASTFKVWSKICTMLHHFREEDRHLRQSRKSWMHPNTTIQSRPDLFNMPRGPKRKS